MAEEWKGGKRRREEEERGEDKLVFSGSDGLDTRMHSDSVFPAGYLCVCLTL